MVMTHTGEPITQDVSDGDFEWHTTDEDKLAEYYATPQ